MFKAYPASLCLAQDEIRLIRLLPGAWADDIRCELVYDTLANVRPYHALSYVWGSSKRVRTILLDGQSFSITVNLESTLRHLRSRIPNTLLWIDALCINQADDSERTHQVNLMGRIYRSSQGVLVYLGDGISRDRHCRKSMLDRIAPPITTFFDNAQDEPRIQEAINPNAFQAPNSRKDTKSDKRMQDTVDIFSLIRAMSWAEHLVDIPLLAMKDDDTARHQALLHMIENLRRLMHAPFTPWWGRIWVVQEVVLPPQVTIICGTVSAPWTMFARAASQCLHHLHHCCSKGMEHLPRDLLNVLQDFGERVTDIDNLRKSNNDNFSEGTTHISEARRSVSTDLSASRGRHDTEEQRSLASLLRRFRGRKASDPRDKVYALLSLIPPDPQRPPLLPDYSLSSAEVYIRATIESIYSSASLSVLTFDIARKYRHDLPTWVPDWEAPGDFSNDTRFHAMEKYDARTIHYIDSDMVKVDYRTLIVEGVWIDYILKSGPVMLSDSPEVLQKTLRQWLDVYASSSWKTKPEMKKKLWRVLCADVILSQPQSERMGTAFRRIVDADELMFVTWARISKQSPFDRKDLVGYIEHYISPTACQWSKMLDFELAILTAGTKKIANHFFSLFPESSIRKDIVDRAMRFARSDKSQNDRQTQDHERLLDYAALDMAQVRDLQWKEHLEKLTTMGQIVGNPRIAHDETKERWLSNDQSDDNRLKAWRKVPWSRVLELVKPQLLQRLGEASKIAQVPYDIQASLIERSIVSATKARKLFITHEGYVGLGPADLEPADALYLLKGGRTPSILRLHDRKNIWCRDGKCVAYRAFERYKSSLYILACYCPKCLEKERWCTNCIAQCAPHYYKVVGDCYAHNFMDSQPIEEHLGQPESHDWMTINLL